MRSLLLWPLLLPLAVSAPIPAPSEPICRAASLSAPDPLPNDAYQGFVGDWTGVLEYRDFQSNERVKLPTWLDVKLSANGAGLDFTYTYDDGPGKIVKELSHIAIDAERHTFIVTSDRDKSEDVYQLSGLESFANTGRGTLQLTGTGTENDHKVDVRITIKLGRNSYSFQKETRVPGADFLFRDGYTFVRRNPPSAP
jgi:hypothetical protein